MFASWLAASTESGSSAKACLNRLVVSANFSREFGFQYAARPRRMYSSASGCSVGREASLLVSSRLSAIAMRLVISF
jgi:hypothetical protein